jgi:hypothetical protein
MTHSLGGGGLVPLQRPVAAEDRAYGGAMVVAQRFNRYQIVQPGCRT